MLRIKMIAKSPPYHSHRTWSIVAWSLSFKWVKRTDRQILFITGLLNHGWPGSDYNQWLSLSKEGNPQRRSSPGSDSPRHTTVNECVSILQEKQSLTFEDLLKEACQRNQQIAAYLVTNYLTKTNIKLRPILAQLLTHSNIRRTGQKPIMLSWL